MDAPTVVALLALHILLSGWLLHVVGRTMAGGGGLRVFAAGAVMFGLAYVARLAIGLTASPPPVVLLDTMMVLAVLLFGTGMRAFFGGRAWRRRTLAGLALGFTVFQAGTLWLGGPQARHVVLNAALGMGYLLLAWFTLQPVWRPAGAPDHAEVRTPALLLGALVGLLGAASLGRAGHIAARGTEVLYSGPVPQAYFAYSSLTALTMSPLVLWMVFRRLTRQLAELATRDALTRVLNRNGLEEALRRHFGARSGHTLAWLVVDIDHFKRINDTHGHGAGDQVLRAVAGVLMQHVRAGDFVARTGGEEFLVGCSDADRRTLATLAERLRGEVQALQVPARGAGEPLRCTVSIGCSAPFERVEGWEEAVRQADAALYRAKAGGRNRVEGAERREPAQ